MAYDKALKDDIDQMPIGDLVHYMLTHYERGREEDGAYMQSAGYFWASERLNMLSGRLPEPGAVKEDAE